MKKIYLTLLLAMIALKGLSQTVSLADLIDNYNGPHNKINIILAKKGFRPDINNPYHMLLYIKAKGEAEEELISDSSGDAQPDGSMKPRLRYTTKDSLYIVNLQKQVQEAGYTLISKKEEAGRLQYNYDNKEFDLGIIYIKNKEYTLTLFRKN